MSETETPAWPEWRLSLAGRIDQLIGWAKAGQRPEYPAEARLYILDAENTDRLRDDILKVVDEVVPADSTQIIAERDAEIAGLRSPGSVTVPLETLRRYLESTDHRDVLVNNDWLALCGAAGLVINADGRRWESPRDGNRALRGADCHRERTGGDGGVSLDPGDGTAGLSAAEEASP